MASTLHLSPTWSRTSRMMSMLSAGQPAHGPGRAAVTSSLATASIAHSPPGRAHGCALCGTNITAVSCGYAQTVGIGVGGRREDRDLVRRHLPLVRSGHPSPGAGAGALRARRRGGGDPPILPTGPHAAE